MIAVCCNFQAIQDFEKVSTETVSPIPRGFICTHPTGSYPAQIMDLFQLCQPIHIHSAQVLRSIVHSGLEGPLGLHTRCMGVVCWSYSNTTYVCIIKNTEARQGMKTFRFPITHLYLDSSRTNRLPSPTCIHLLTTRYIYATQSVVLVGAYSEG